MAAGYNRVIMIGNLTRDPEYKQLASGQAVCRLGIASNRQYKNRQNGDMVQEVCFIDVDVWGAQAESCRQYLEKGRPVLVEGRLKFDQWEDQAGQNRSKHSLVADRVVFLAAANEQGVEQQEAAAPSDEVNAPGNDMERELMAQIKRIKERESAVNVGATKIQSTTNVARKESSKKSNDSSMGLEHAASTVDFKDEPPFQDDLPF